MFFNDRIGVLQDGGRVVDVTKVVPFGETIPRTGVDLESSRA